MSSVDNFIKKLKNTFEKEKSDFFSKIKNKNKSKLKYEWKNHTNYRNNIIDIFNTNKKIYSDYILDKYVYIFDKYINYNKVKKISE